MSSQIFEKNILLCYLLISSCELRIISYVDKGHKHFLKEIILNSHSLHNLPLISILVAENELMVTPSEKFPKISLHLFLVRFVRLTVKPV